MKILVTGATGFIGANIALKLADKGHLVHALCRSKPDSKLVDHPKILVFRGDILNKEDLLNAMRDCEQVFHLAAYARTGSGDPRPYYSTNVSGTINVMDSAVELSVKRVIYTSTAGTYGPSDHTPTTEDSPRLSPFYNDYECSKYISEVKIRDYAERGFDVVTLNPSRVYGPGLLSQSNYLTHLILSYMKGKWHIIPGNGKVVANYVFIDDIVDGHINAMEYARAGERYILGGIDASYNELFEIIRQHLNKKHRLFKVPLSLIKTYAAGELVLSKILARDPVITPRWVKALETDGFRSSEKAIKELKYSITHLDEGIKRTIDWLNNEVI